MAKRVKDYWPGDLEREMRQALLWLYGRQSAPVGNWRGNALATATTPAMSQSGIISCADFADFAQAAIENIVFDVPTGATEDLAAGPDGFPVNYSPIALPNGRVFLNTFMLTADMTVAGRCFALSSAPSAYRVDLFARTDVWTYKGSASLTDAGGGLATWSESVTYGGTPGALMAVLYPTSVSEPPPGWSGADLPAGWKAHTNMGVGKKLTEYIGRVYSKTDIEYLEEDNLPVIVQDPRHARVGSTKGIGTGTPTTHLVYNDPVAGWVSVFSTVQHLAALAGLPRSLDVPTSDPVYAPDITITNSSAARNRSWTYDAALAIIAYAYAGNHALARRAIDALNGLLDERQYLAETVLENCEDGSAARWSKTNPSSTITMWNDPLRAPYGGGKQAKMTSAASGDRFSWIGPAVYGGGLPSGQHMIQWQFRAHSSLAWRFEVEVVTVFDKVRKLVVTSGPAGPPSYDNPSKTITYPIGPGNDDYHLHTFNLTELAANLALDIHTVTNGFSLVLEAVGDLHLDNLTLGGLQPDGSLSFSYDVYNGLPDQAHIRTGSVAWMCYAYALYMEMTADYTSALYLERMLNFLLSLESADADLRNGLLKGGHGAYEAPGSHFVPGLRPWVSTEHNLAAYFAFKRAARVLPMAATELSKRGLITSVQATSLNTTATTVGSKADDVKTKVLTNLYIPEGTLGPADLSGLRLWLNTDALAGLSDGDPVAVWPDSSGAGNDAAQSVPSRRPVYKVGVLGGQNAVRFDGVDDFLDVSALPVPSTATLFFVVSNNHKSNPDRSSPVFSRRHSTLIPPTALDFQFTAGSDHPQVRINDDAQVGALAEGSAGSTGPGVFGAIREGGTVKVRKNGVQLDEDTNTVGTITTDTTRLGTHGWGASPVHFLDGDLAEVIFYDRVLSDSEIQAIEGYLGDKYGIAAGDAVILPGHFAQGVLESGVLDRAAALDSAGSWAAILCHEVGEDAKAAECLKFIHQRLFLTNKQILKSAQSADWNMAYEQLTPFDGFTAYGGGYASPPETVWQEGTWGALNALLRCSEITAVQGYFASAEGSLDQFLSRLARGQKTVLAATGPPAEAPAGGLLNYSLAARSLPYEFSVWPGIGSTAWMWLTAMNPTLLLSHETAWELRPYLKVPRGVEQSVRQLDGRGSIGALEVEAVDAAGYITALGSGGKLEGRRVALKVGYPGLATSDFVTVITQEIESVEILGDYTGFKLNCRDLKRSAKSKVFLKGDDAFPISQDHPRVLLANPMDICLILFQNELGFGQPAGAPQSAWRIYDPGEWSGGANPTLIAPNPYLDLAWFLFYRDGIFAGYQLAFEFSQPVEAKQFLEHEIFKALGGYLIVLADGSLSPRFFVPPYALSNFFLFSDDNMTVLPAMERHPIVNQVSYRMDYDGSKFQTELLFVSAPSLQQFGLAGQHIIESKGMKLARGGASLAGMTADRIFRRYAGIDPVSGDPTGGAVILTVTAHYMTLPVDVGDFVYLNSAFLPNFRAGQRGVVGQIFEVIEKQPNFTEGTMRYKLLDTSWFGSKKLSRIAPDGSPAWPTASESQRGKYMFACAEATLAYSDGTEGKTIF